MKRILLLVLLVLCVFAVLLPGAGWATPGIFEGKVYRPVNMRIPQGWMFVQGRNGMLRKVEISKAVVAYADTVPAHERAGEPAQALVHGAEVRVTAEQDRRGEWRAIRVEILKLSGQTRHQAALELSFRR